MPELSSVAVAPSTTPDGGPRTTFAVRRWGLTPGAEIPYEQAWTEQQRLHAGVVAGTEPPTLLLLQHPPVFTAGRRTQPQDRPFDGTPVIEVDRGGRITWHGPGQLVGYPIVRLPDPLNVVAHVRTLEQALIDVCATLGVQAERVEGRSGVWLPGDPALLRPARKVAAIGVRVARGVTMHGFALNCDPDLSWFDRIVPCGIPDAGVTSLTAELGRRVGVTDVVDAVESAVLAGLSGPGRPGLGDLG